MKDRSKNKEEVVKHVGPRIVYLEGRPPVMLDRDVAAFYGVKTERLNEQVKRNEDRFPIPEFRFQPTPSERSQIASFLNIQAFTYTPWCYPQEGAHMSAFVLHTDYAVKQSIKIVFLFSEEERKREFENFEPPFSSLQALHYQSGQLHHAIGRMVELEEEQKVARKEREIARVERVQLGGRIDEVDERVDGLSEKTDTIMDQTWDLRQNVHVIDSDVYEVKKGMDSFTEVTESKLNNLEGDFIDFSERLEVVEGAVVVDRERFPEYWEDLTDELKESAWTIMYGKYKIYGEQKQKMRDRGVWGHFYKYLADICEEENKLIDGGDKLRKYIPILLGIYERNRKKDKKRGHPYGKKLNNGWEYAKADPDNKLHPDIQRIFFDAAEQFYIKGDTTVALEQRIKNKQGVWLK